MSWHHRVMKKKGEDGEYYKIEEVYYNYDGSVMSWTEDLSCPFADTAEELKEELTMMLKAFDKPILDEELEMKNARSSEEV